MNTSRILASIISVFALMAATLTSKAVAQDISAEERLALQATWEERLQEKILSAFEELGVKAVVRVSVQMEWTTEKHEAIRLDAPVLISHAENIIEEISLGNADASNALGDVPPEKSTKTSEVIKNFDPPREVTESVTPSGIVRHLSVAAFVEGHVTPVYDEHHKKTGEFDYTPLGPDQTSIYREFIHAAVGAGIEETKVFVSDHYFQRTRKSRR